MTIEASENPHIDFSPASLEKAGRVFSSLSKLVLGKKIYADNNPTLIKFAHEFEAALHDFFIEEDDLVVAIDKFAVKWKDRVVYENDKRDESIAFLLHKDGIGELSIHRSVTPGEMEAFVDLIKDEIRNASPDDDIVTKFWKADFEHISYRVLDEYLVGEFGEGRRGEARSNLKTLQHVDHPEIPSIGDRGRILVGDGQDLESIGHYLRGLVFHGGMFESEGEEEEQFQNAMEMIFGVSAGELRHCHDELIREKETDGLVRFVDDCLDFTLMKDNPSAVRDVMNVIECLIDKIIAELNAVVLEQTLECFRKFSASQMIPPNIQAFCENIESRLTDSSVLLSLGETVRSAEDGAPIFHFYQRVGGAALAPILKLLESSTDSKLHRDACDSIAAIAGERLPAIVEELNIDNPLIARDVIRLIKEPKPTALPHVIKELMYYPDFQVRAEAIHFLAGFGDDESALLLARLLDDTEKNTRLRTITAISEMPHPILKNRIEEIAFGKDTATRELDEQIEIYRALGRLCGKDVVPRLQQIIGRNRLFFFRRRKNKGARLLVVYALEQIDDPAAAELLKSLAEDTDTRIATKAKQVLESLETKRRRSGRGE